MLMSHVHARQKRARQHVADNARPTASLLELARRHLRVATHSVARRSAHDLHPGQVSGLRQVLVAAKAGEVLVGDWLVGGGGWTAQVLVGQVQLLHPRSSWPGWPGDLMVAADRGPELRAVTDAVVVVSTAGAPGAPPAADSREWSHG
jgi:hypothetical protein